MAETSAIEWTDATVNFWWGCTKVGPGCDHCYAETWSKRTGGALWGVGAARRKIKGAVALIHRLDNNYSWWAADHHIGGIHATGRRRVFIQSMSDLFDTEVPLEWFDEAWGRIEVCDRLAIQIVTKRISVVEKRLAAIGRTTWPKHAGLMISVVNQNEAARDIPRLLALKAKLGIPWVGLSMEPLLGPVDVRSIRLPDTLDVGCADVKLDALTGYHRGVPRMDGRAEVPSLPPPSAALDWVIVGGESGPGARPMHPDWVRAIRDQCAAASVPFLFKQWGEWLPGQNEIYPGWDGRRVARHQDGGWGSRDAKRGGYAMWGSDGGLRLGLATDHPHFSLTHWAMRVGKKKAGRLLDGMQHDGLPPFDTTDSRSAVAA